MKIEGLKLFAGLFGASAKAAAPEARQSSEAFSDVLVTAASQPYVLQGKMMEKKMTHGETVTATLSPVRLETSSKGMVIYFCPLRNLEIAETLTPGDGGEIPPSVVVEDFTLSEHFPPGLYTLKKVQLSSNGAIQIKNTAATELEMIE